MTWTYAHIHQILQRQLEYTNGIYLIAVLKLQFVNVNKPNKPQDVFIHSSFFLYFCLPSLFTFLLFLFDDNFVKENY